MKYGIWNNRQQKFQFGISADSEDEAIDQLFDKIGKDANRWRFEAKKLPLTKTCSICNTAFKTYDTPQHRCTSCNKKIKEACNERR